MSIIYINPYQFAAAAALLLDDYPGAAAAYSLRQLRTGVTNVVRVRRSSDSTEQDFTAAQVSDGTLAAWVGAGNDGFVRTWYDQSGNGRDAQQSTNQSQPKIVDEGSVLTENGQASLNFDGIDDYLRTSSFSLQTSDLSFFNVFRFNALTNFQTFISYGGFVANGFLLQRPNIDAFRYATKGAFIDYGSNLTTNQSLIELHDKANGFVEIFRDGVSLQERAQTTLINGANVLELGRRTDSTSQYTNMEAQEFVFYPSDQSTNRAAIEANINAHYNIF